MEEGSVLLIAFVCFAKQAVLLTSFKRVPVFFCPICSGVYLLLTACGVHAQGAGAARAHRAAGAGPQAPPAAVRRPAATRRARPSAGFQPALAAAGRAFWRPGPHGKQQSPAPLHAVGVINIY